MCAYCPVPTQARNSGRAEQCWVWLGATEGGTRGLGAYDLLDRGDAPQ